MATIEQFGEVPALIIKSDDQPKPFLFWIHGRTADKELDPGRYLRYVRRGINICAVDLPGHGERFVASLQEPEAAYEVVKQMSEEVDGVLESLATIDGFDLQRAAIGGMSAGGLASILRLVHPHPFKAAVLEATMGQWRLSRHHKIFSHLSDVEFAASNPADQLDHWREIPIVSFHSRHDEWMPYAAQEEFIARLKQRYQAPEKIEFVTFEHTGSPKEHLGFGRESAFVKDVQVEFLARALEVSMEKIK
jgi:pimeloyl-ACP methyl ester carboxylesterase